MIFVVLPLGAAQLRDKHRSHKNVVEDFLCLNVKSHCQDAAPPAASPTSLSRGQRQIREERRHQPVNKDDAFRPNSRKACRQALRRSHPFVYTVDK